MRLEGTASIDLDDPLRVDYPEAQLVVRVRARAVYPNCPRYVHRYELVRRSRFVPRSDCLTPVPEWKRSDWAVDVLPQDDPPTTRVSVTCSDDDPPARRTGVQPCARIGPSTSPIGKTSRAAVSAPVTRVSGGSAAGM